MSERLPTHVQYRNASYFGQFVQYSRHGHGMLILDNSAILLATWRHNQIQGKYVYIGEQLRAYGHMAAGKLEGYNIISTSHPQQPDRTIYGMFRQDKLYGKVVHVEGGQVMVAQLANSELKEVISKAPVRNREVYEALTQHFPKHMYTLEEFLIAFMQDALAAAQTQEQIPRYMPISLSLSSSAEGGLEDKFFGYEECFNRGRRYGFILSGNKVLSVGEHFNNMLEGIGRFYAEDCIEDGIFKEGHLRGIGIKYYPQGNKYSLGEHDGKSALEKGFGFPHRQICEIRKQFHLRSIYFYNDIVMLGLNAHFNALLNSLVMEMRHIRSSVRHESPKFNIGPQQQRSLLTNNPHLYKYEVDPDIIDDSSPIQDKHFGEYRPVDKKNTKYFTLDQEEEEYDRRKMKERSIGKIGQLQNREKEPSSRHTPTSRFRETPASELSQASRNSRGRMGVSQNRQKSVTKGSAKSGVKDTRQFVRQLEEEEKRKRLDLDKIYRQAGLYRKK